jgi:hypothetical protein
MALNEAAATLKFGQARVMTDDLILKGDTLSVTGQGWIDWDQNIEFALSPKLEAPSNADGTANPLQLLNPTDGLINIHVSGTCQAPRIEHNITTPKVIQKTIQKTIGNLLGIFE